MQHVDMLAVHKTTKVAFLIFAVLDVISAASEPKFTILRGHMEIILLLNKFFPIVDMCLIR